MDDIQVASARAEEFIAEAVSIGDKLIASSIQDSELAVNWVGFEYVDDVDRFRLRMLSDNLYDGRGGLAIFFAALRSLTGQARYEEFARRCLAPLQNRRHNTPRSSMHFVGLGGAVGYGSYIYALVRLAGFIGDANLLEDASAFAGWISPELVEADNNLDIMGGAAGALISLLSLYDAGRDDSVVESAVLCGEHLLKTQIASGRMRGGWSSRRAEPLAGFSHGAAGISYALVRLYGVTGDKRYLDGAMAGIAFERSVYSEQEKNWPDLRHLNGKDTFPVKWCHGAAGIALGRLGCRAILQTPVLDDDINVALQTTRLNMLQHVDCLCCGNFGRIEALLVASQLYSSLEWRDIAVDGAGRIVTRARANGSYSLFSENSVFNPGFFQGMAGIGYQLLRLARADMPSILLWE